MNAREVVGKSRIFDVWLEPVEPEYRQELVEGFDAVRDAYPQFNIGVPPPIEFVATKIVPLGRS